MARLRRVRGATDYAAELQTRGREDARPCSEKTEAAEPAFAEPPARQGKRKPSRREAESDHHERPDPISRFASSGKR